MAGGVLEGVGAGSETGDGAAGLLEVEDGLELVFRVLAPAEE